MDFDVAKDMVEEFFNGQYEVKRFLGEGSFAEVYLVKHNYLNDLRALKIIKEPLSQTTNIKSVFSEVMIATQLRHENIISIYDAGIMSASGLGGYDRNDKKDFAFFVMEYVPGGDLEQYLSSFINSDLKMPISRVLDIVKQMLKGLNVLHSSNPPIVHRDLKLKNILLNYASNGDIVIKISDFGFAKAVTKGIRDIDIVGTRPYMAPECFSKAVSTMTDVYAIGVIFYQLLTSHYPYGVDEFSIDDFLDLKPWDLDLKPPSFYNEKVSSDLDRIVMKCLQANPDKRYDDASELLEDVNSIIEECSLSPVNLIDDENLDDDFNYVINDSLNEAFGLAKLENKLNEAIEILEVEVLKDYEIRRCYGETLRIWKSENPDVNLISKAFSVNLKGKNYDISSYLLKEAIAYNPLVNYKYGHYLDLWKIFIDLAKSGNLIKAVLDLEKLMNSNHHIHEIYADIINILKTYSIEEIVSKSVRLADSNNLKDASNLLEFAVVSNMRIRMDYAYKLSMWKQNMKTHFTTDFEFENDSVDYAIDLGTADSVVACFNNGNPKVIKNHVTGDDFTPSAIFIDGQGNIQVGENARNAILVDDKNAVSEFKSNMGFRVFYEFESSSKVLFPEELSAEVLKYLRTSVYETTSENIEHVVICVPANSNPIKTKAVNDAADIAGFRSHNLILEPMAVALAYNLKLKNKSDKLWMVYDMGGSTFDVSLIGYKDGEFEKVATSGLANVGGNIFDWAIVNEIFVPKIRRDLKLDDFVFDNPKYRNAFSNLKIASENSKKELSKSSATDICINNLFDDYDFRYNLTRENFKKIIAPYMEHTFNLCRDLLENNSLDDGDIDRIILVGGSCLSPLVWEFVSEEFKIDVEHSIDPLTVVAKGASIYAGSLKKPAVESECEDVSLILNRDNYDIDGRVFTLDDKFSFLGYDIEFMDSLTGESLCRMPLNIDGTFKAQFSCNEFYINVYNGDNLVKFNEKSPNKIAGDNIKIDYFNKSSALTNAQLNLFDLANRYYRLINDIEFLGQYSFSFDGEIIEYVKRLFDLIQIDGNALMLFSVYLRHLESVAEKYTEELEFSVLLENVENKIRIVKGNNLFDINLDNFDSICKDKDLSQLKRLHTWLIEEYVRLNKNNVIKECYYNLKHYGIYQDSQTYDDLTTEAEKALSSQDYEKLFFIVNQLYELDKRKEDNYEG